MRRTPVWILAVVALSGVAWTGGVHATAFAGDAAAYVALGALGFLAVRGAYRCGREEPAGGRGPR